MHFRSPPSGTKTRHRRGQNVHLPGPDPTLLAAPAMRDGSDERDYSRSVFGVWGWWAAHIFYVLLHGPA